MSEYSISNGKISIKINSKGAELKSLVNNKTKQEYMWKADPEYWGRTSPVLFPFVGSLYNKEYRTKGNTYPMNQHGFARDMEFTLVSKKHKKITFELNSDDETLKKYPYNFRLRISYKIDNKKLYVKWSVKNTGNETMPFSIGGHPAFNCPLGKDDDRFEYSILFESKDKVISSRLGTNGTVSDKKEVYELENGYLKITPELFKNDALIIENNQAKNVSLCAPDGKPYLSVNMQAPLFGVWSPYKEGVPFVCIEPWYGRCDKDKYVGELKDRDWENIIEPGVVWKAGYSISVN